MLAEADLIDFAGLYLTGRGDGGRCLKARLSPSLDDPRIAVRTRRDIGAGVEAYVADISKLQDLDALGAYVKAKHDRLDIVFANAAGERPGMFKDGLPTRFEDVSEDDFDFLSDVNFKGTFFTVQKLVPLMTAGGAVILTSSFLAARGRPGFAVYAATRAAIRSLVQSLTAELSDQGIRTNAVAPGFIETDLLRSNGAGDGLIEQAKAQSIAEIPQHRSGTVDDIAGAVLFPASDEAAHVTGIELRSTAAGVRSDGRSGGPLLTWNLEIGSHMKKVVLVTGGTAGIGLGLGPGEGLFGQGRPSRS